MRRSCAPSIASKSTKRVKFNSPFRHDSVVNPTDVAVAETSNNIAKKFGISLIDNDEADDCGINSSTDRICQNNTKNVCVNQSEESIQGKSSNTEISQAIKQVSKGTIHDIVPKPFKPFMSPLVNSSTNKNISTQSVSNDYTEEYYSVVWCKVSNKKHKKWEGDGLLIVCGKLAILKDMEGKQICRGSGYKSSEISDMCDGSTLKIGGKEIEVQGKISKECYLSGKCFSNVGISSDSGVTQSHRKIAPAKPFIPHQLNTSNQKASSVILKPRYDPNKEGALVMPRPKNPHKWNNSKQEVVDVVVDPVISYHLRPHQREGVTFLYECVMGMKPTSGNGAILADEMGLGKTLQCIALIWTLLKQSPYSGSPSAKKVIVVTPGSLVKNWCYEFTKWLGSERLVPFAINSNNRVDEYILHPKSPVMVISYEMFLRCINDIRKVKFDLVICDEAHRLKNARIKTGEALSSLGIVKRIFLTGTPIQNNLEEFYTLAEMSNPGIFGSLGGFKKVFIEPITRSQQPECDDDERALGNNRAVELSRLTSLFCLRRTADINKEYLPPKVEHVLFVKMSELQLKIYNHLLTSSFVTRCFSSSYNGSQHLVCINALKKLCNDPKLIYRSMEEKENNDEEGFLVASHLKSLFPNDYIMLQNSFLHSAKLCVLRKLLNSFFLRKEKTVIISNSTKTLDILQDFCKSSSYSYTRLDGQTQLASRQNLVDRFNDKSSNVFVFLLSSKAGGVGLNLTGASKLLLYDIDWNPANDMQSMARVWRDGQKKEVHIYRFLITGSIEEKMYQRQINKQALSGTVVDSLCTDKAEFSKKDLKDLFTLRNSDTCSTHELLQCDCLQDETSGKKYIADKDSIHQKSASMAELMLWEHISDVKNADDMEEGLKTCDSVSFMFRCRSG